MFFKLTLSFKADAEGKYKLTVKANCVIDL